MSRVDTLEYPEQHKIGTRLLFAGNITRQPYFEGRYEYVATSQASNDPVMNYTFWIGVFAALNTETLDSTAQTISVFMETGF